MQAETPGTRPKKWLQSGADLKSGVFDHALDARLYIQYPYLLETFFSLPYYQVKGEGCRITWVGILKKREYEGLGEDCDFHPHSMSEHSFFFRIAENW